jgi:NitT/TauT family transport system ATP-binding protein
VNSQYEPGFEVEVRSVSKGFLGREKHVPVLENVTFQAASGEVVAICGLSGVGKSTLLRLIAGLIGLSQGQILVGGEIVTKPRENMGFVTQDYSRSLLPWLTVAGNVALPFRGHHVPRSERVQRVTNILSAVGLSDVSSYFPWQLSGGMQQRVAIARALIVRPRLLLLDEPFASVDAHIRLELEDLVAGLIREHGITTILVTHDVDEAIYMADRVVVLSATPASVRMEIVVDLPEPRDQLSTRSLERFISLRKELYLALRK